jgi:hypothetical protein
MSTSEPRGIAGIEKTLFEQVWAIVKQLDEREKHFNDLQARYRTLASTWLLATFAGIGYVFTQSIASGVQLPWSRDAIAAAIALSGAVGITLLWVLDVLVYHQLLVAGYAAGARLEERYEWLPPIRKSSSKVGKKRHAVRWAIAIFYAVGISILCILASAICWSCVAPRSGAVFLLVGIVLDATIVVGTLRSLRRRRQLQEELGSWLANAPRTPG